MQGDSLLGTHSSPSLLKDTRGCGQLASVWRQKCEVCSTLKAPGDGHEPPGRCRQQQKGAGMVQAYVLEGQTLHVNGPGLV